MCKFMSDMGLPCGPKGYMALGVMGLLALALMIALTSVIGGTIASIL